MPKWILRGARLRRLWSASITHLSWDQVTDKGGKHWNHNIVSVAVIDLPLLMISNPVGTNPSFIGAFSLGLTYVPARL